MAQSKPQRWAWLAGVWKHGLAVAAAAALAIRFPSRGPLIASLYL